MNEDLIDRLRLVRSPGIGPVTFRQLIRVSGTRRRRLRPFPTWPGGVAESRRSSSTAREPSARSPGLRSSEQGISTLGQGLYPRLLAELEDAPPLLIAKGNLNLLDRTAVAIVGARNASAAACRFARGLAHDLGQDDLVVVSGLARGVDTAAHEGALDTGTIGVIAGGIDVFYPPENEERQRAIVRAWPGARRDAAGH